jgi:transcriptional regulator with XRE-family HTH domain
MDLKAVFGRAVRYHRTRQGYGVRELARMMGMAAPNISHIERGTYNVTLETIQKYADALDVPPICLLTEYNEE